MGNTLTISDVQAALINTDPLTALALKERRVARFDTVENAVPLLAKTALMGTQQKGAGNA